MLRVPSYGLELQSQAFVYDILISTEHGVGVAEETVKFLVCDHKDLSLHPSIHVKSGHDDISL